VVILGASPSACAVDGGVWHDNAPRINSNRNDNNNNINSNNSNNNNNCVTRRFAKQSLLVPFTAAPFLSVYDDNDDDATADVDGINVGDASDKNSGDKKRTKKNTKKSAKGDENEKSSADGVGGGVDATCVLSPHDAQRVNTAVDDMRNGEGTNDRGDVSWSRLLNAVKST
jgi:hypothetical protein